MRSSKISTVAVVLCVIFFSFPSAFVCYQYILWVWNLILYYFGGFSVAWMFRGIYIFLMVCVVVVVFLYLFASTKYYFSARDESIFLYMIFFFLVPFPLYVVCDYIGRRCICVYVYVCVRAVLWIRKYRRLNIYALYCIFILVFIHHCVVVVSLLLPLPSYDGKSIQTNKC